MRILSLYCGGGGIDEGLKQAGLTTTTAIDSDPDCCATMRANHPDTEIIHSTVRDAAASLGRYDLVVGGPPCQNFSTANTQKTMDPTEVNRFFRIVKNTGAKHVIMENVQGVLKVLPADLPYHKHFVNCADYGVPQIRRRAIVTDLGLPRPTHSEYGAQSTLDGLHLHPWVTIYDALGLKGGIRNANWGDRKGFDSTDRPASTIMATGWYHFIQDRRHQDGVRNYSIDRPACTIQTDTRLFLMAELEKKYPQRFVKHAPSHIDKPSHTIVAKDYCTTDKMVTDGVYARKLTVEETGRPPRLPSELHLYPATRGSGSGR